MSRCHIPGPRLHYRRLVSSMIALIIDQETFFSDPFMSLQDAHSTQIHAL